MPYACDGPDCPGEDAVLSVSNMGTGDVQFLGPFCLVAWCAGMVQSMGWTVTPPASDDTADAGGDEGPGGFTDDPIAAALGDPAPDGGKPPVVEAAPEPETAAQPD